MVLGGAPLVSGLVRIQLPDEDLVIKTLVFVLSMKNVEVECGHSRAKGHQQGRCVDCLGRTHAEATLEEEDIL